MNVFIVLFLAGHVGAAMREIQKNLASSNAGAHEPFEVFFDGDCPLCRREIAFLKKRIGVENDASTICFRDIQAIESPESQLGKSRQQLMGEIHGRLPDGTWITGVEVFRRMYDEIGWTMIVAVSRWPGVRGLLDWLYAKFSKRRLWLTGRCSDSCEVH